MGDTVDVTSHNAAAYKEDIHMEEKKDQKRKKDSKFQVSFEKQDADLNSSTGLDAEKDLKRKRKKGNDKLSTEVPVDEEDDFIVEKKEKKRETKGEQGNLCHLEVEKNTTQKGRKTNYMLQKKEVPVLKEGIMVDEKQKKKRLEKQAEVDIIDDAGISFTELFTTDVPDTKSSGGLVTYPVKKKKSKRAVLTELQMSPALEVGMGGASTWDE